MRADTFAKLMLLETLVEAEIGFLLEHRPPSTDRFREGMIARVSELVDDIDALDEVAAARVYDALVDFLAELPEDEDGVVEAAVRFRRTLERSVERSTVPSERDDPALWAVVTDELLEALADEYEAAFAGGELRPREYLRACGLVERARLAADRMAADEPPERRSAVRDAMDRLGFAVRHRRVKPAALDALLHVPMREARRRRPSGLARMGAFVVGQLLRRRGSEPGTPRTPE
jgi:hypothetical protein